MAQERAALPVAPNVTVRRFELGGQVTDSQFARCFSVVNASCLSTPQFALGSGVTFNFNTHLALDAVYSVMAGFQTRLDINTGGRGTQMLVGLRAEQRGQRYALFAFDRPGFVRWSSVQVGWDPNSGLPTYSGETYFANEAGGGVEYFLSHRVHVRVEAGDILVDRRNHICSDCATWTNNLQTSGGVYVGVGRSITPKKLRPEVEPPHRFFDRTNLALISLSLLGQSADDITTQRFHSHGEQEGNPLARPFVNQGWAGQIGLAAIYNAAQVTVMYGLHKMGQHKVEKALPLVVATEGAYRGYRNLQGE